MVQRRFVHVVCGSERSGRRVQQQLHRLQLASNCIECTASGRQVEREVAVPVLDSSGLWRDGKDEPHLLGVAAPSSTMQHQLTKAVLWCGGHCRSLLQRTLSCLPPLALRLQPLLQGKLLLHSPLLSCLPRLALRL